MYCVLVVFLCCSCNINDRCCCVCDFVALLSSFVVGLVCVLKRVVVVCFCCFVCVETCCVLLLIIHVYGLGCCLRFFFVFACVWFVCSCCSFLFL